MVLDRFKKNKKNGADISSRKSGVGDNRKKSSVLMDAPCKDFIVSVYNNLNDNVVTFLIFLQHFTFFFVFMRACLCVFVQ